MNTITMVAWSNNKKNKTRSILIMLAVFLSAVLLTVISTSAYGLIHMEKENAAGKYGSDYGIFRSVKPKQLEEMKRHGEFSLTGVTASAGMADVEGVYGLFMSDANYREMSNLASLLSEGSFPEKENEILAQREFFEVIGYGDVQIGDSVTFPYRADLKHGFEPVEFVVSGFMEVPDTGVPQTVFSAYVSEAFYHAQIAEDDWQYTVSFRLSEDVPITYDSAQEVIEAIAADCGISKQNVSINTMYLLYTLNPGTETLFVCGVTALGIILFSVAVIYNIFQVGIVQNIREYGKIRALGATKKQMKKLIFDEGMFLAACSIPPGILAGYGTAWAGFQWLMKQSVQVDGKMEQVRLFSLPCLLLAAGMAFLTMLLALHRPMKIVSSISPADALRYMESTGTRNAGIRKGRKNLSVWSLAAASIAADRKRTVRTILTMGLSCVLFVVLANCAGNMDPGYDARNYVEKGQFLIELLYSIGDEAYPENNLDAVLKDNPLNDEMIKQIQAADGVTGVWMRNILLADINGSQEVAEVLTEADFEKKKQGPSCMGRLEYEDSLEQNTVYYGWSHFMEDYGYVTGQDISMELQNGTSSVSMTGTLAGAFGSSSASWVITEDMYRKLNLQGDSPGMLWVDCREEDAAAVRTELEQLLQGVEHVELTVFSDVLDRSELGVRMIKVVCYLFLAVIGMIGFMNLANTMIMSIVTKKQEYGILQAAGMTSRQLNAVLQIQGLLFSAGTVLAAVIVGLPAGYGLFRFAKENGIFGLNVYHVPVAELACMIAAIGLLQAAVSYLLSRNLKKESLVERIRHQE